MGNLNTRIKPERDSLLLAAWHVYILCLGYCRSMTDKFPDHGTGLVRSWVGLNTPKTSGYFFVFMVIGQGARTGASTGSNVGIDPTWAISREGFLGMLNMFRLTVEVS